jgi:hypothetical protein
MQNIYGERYDTRSNAVNFQGVNKALLRVQKDTKIGIYS